MKNSDLVAIITINYNHSSDTLKCVNSIMKSKDVNFHLFVIDNGSEERDYNILKNTLANEKNISVIRLEKNVGYVGGVNKGILHAKNISADYILIMNNDTLIDDKAIFELVKVSKKYKNKAIVSGKVYNMHKPDTLQYIGQKKSIKNKRLIFPPVIKNSEEKDVGQYDYEMEMGMLDDIYWLVPIEIIEKVGLYSKYFFLYGEQNDYALRAVNAGYKLIYTPHAKIWHHHHLTTGGTPKANRRIIYWREFASYLLIFRHLKLNYFIIEYIKKAIYSIGGFFISIIDSNKRKNKYKPKLLALFYFTIWLFKRNENNGFNPYN